MTATPIGEPATTRWRIVVADDHAATAESLALLLTLDGHQVVTAHDGPTALATVRVFCPDAVLLDIGLPGMDGYEVAQQLRREIGGKKIMLVAVSGYGDSSDLTRASEAQFDHFLTKPINGKTLAQVLSTLPARQTTAKLL